MAYPHDELKCAPLAVLAHRINQYQESLNGYTRNRLQVALDQGDVLALFKQRVGNRKWKEYREDNCPKVAERTDALHRRLAAHRARIEQALTADPDLGVVEAAKLISTPKPPKPKVSKKSTSEIVVVVATTPTVSVSSRTSPAHPMGDAGRTAVIGLALEALNVSRRPVSAPNLEIVQDLLGQIIRAAKAVAQPARPPVLDTTLFDKAMTVTPAVGDHASVH